MSTDVRSPAALAEDFAARFAAIAATRMHYTLARSDARAGTLHVHFPRIGYVLRAI